MYVKAIIRFLFILDLHFLKTVFPQGSVRSDTIVTEINENVHSVTVHGLTHENIVVVVVSEDLLDSSGSASLERLDSLFGGFPLLKLVVDTLDVG
jgi:hypothetical protein